jgi:hypothetical protein
VCYLQYDFAGGMMLDANAGWRCRSADEDFMIANSQTNILDVSDGRHEFSRPESGPFFRLMIIHMAVAFWGMKLIQIIMSCH